MSASLAIGIATGVALASANTASSGTYTEGSGKAMAAIFLFMVASTLIGIGVQQVRRWKTGPWPDWWHGPDLMNGALFGALIGIVLPLTIACIAAFI